MSKKVSKVYFTQLHCAPSNWPLDRLCSLSVRSLMLRPQLKPRSFSERTRRLADVKTNVALSLPLSAACFLEDRLQPVQGDPYGFATDFQTERVLPTRQYLIGGLVCWL